MRSKVSARPNAIFFQESLLAPFKSGLFKVNCRFAFYIVKTATISAIRFLQQTFT